MSPSWQEANYYICVYLRTYNRKQPLKIKQKQLTHTYKQWIKTPPPPQNKQWKKITYRCTWYPPESYRVDTCTRYPPLLVQWVDRGPHTSPYSGNHQILVGRDNLWSLQSNQISNMWANANLYESVNDWMVTWRNTSLEWTKMQFKFRNKVRPICPLPLHRSLSPPLINSCPPPTTFSLPTSEQV